MNKFNKVLSISIVFVVILYIGISIFIYKTGVDYANEHDFISSYETGYFPGEVTYDEFTNEAVVPAKSFFMYYNEEGQKITNLGENFKEYNDMNRFSSNMYEGIKTLSIGIALLSIIGLFVSLSKRINYISFIMAIFFSFLIFIDVGILNIFTIVIALGLLVSSYYMLKAKFIDYDETYMPFVVKTNLDS